MAKLQPTNEPNGFPESVLESEEDIRKAWLAHQAAAAVPIAVPVSAPKVVREAVPYRPTTRPSVCVLTFCDDGKADGEVVRIRSNRFVIGRTEGDFQLPHDEHVSSRHLEITRQVIGGQHRWVVSDLRSTNGTFLRVSRTILLDQSELLVGKGRYRFEEAGRQNPLSTNRASAPIPSGTLAVADSTPANVHPALVEVIGASMGNRILLAKNEYWIGSDPTCSICRPDDPFVEAKHVRLFRDERGIWSAQNNKSLNGLWIRTPQVTVDDACLLQIGEQRIRLKVER